LSHCPEAFKAKLVTAIRAASDFLAPASAIEHGAEVIFREVEDHDLIGRARRGDVQAYNLQVPRWEKRAFDYLLRLS
jgi:hypothetical protein